VCEDLRDTVVPCHLRDQFTGGAQKASDLSTADGCFQCHAVLDRRAKLPNGEYISQADWDHYALRGLQETLERRRTMRLLIVVGDKTDQPPKPKAPRPRTDSAKRKKIPSRTEIRSRRFEPGHRELQTANRLPRKGQVKFARRGMQMKGEY
jgi:hypothetical protein